MSATRKKKKKKQRSGLWVLAIIVGLIIAVIDVSALSMKKTLDEDTALEAELQSQLDEETQRTSDIEEYAKYTKTRKYIEEVAKEKLGLVYEGETVFKNEDGN